MSKQDQAARIAEKVRPLLCGSLGDTADLEVYKIEVSIRSAIAAGKYAAVRKERERCVQAVWDECNTRPQNAARRNSCGRILDAIRKGKA